MCLYRDSVDTATNEVCLADIERGDYHLYFLDSVHRDRVTASGKIIRKAEVVIKVRSIYRKVRGTAIATGKTHVGGIRRKACDIGDTTVNGG